MAMLNRPDYSFQGQVPTSSIIQAYQEKALAEEKSRKEVELAKEQKWIDTAKIVQAGADMVTKMTEQSKLKAQEDAQTALQGLLSQASTPYTNEDASGYIQYKDTPQYKAELASLVAQGYPKETGTQVVKTAFDQLYGGSTSTNGKPQMIRYALQSDPNKSLLGFADPNGRVIYDQFNKPITEPVVAAYAMGFGEDPGTGAAIGMNRATGGVNPVTVPSQEPFRKKETIGTGGLQELRAKAPKIAVQVEKIREDSYPQTNKALETQVNGATAASQVRAILSSEGEDMSQVGLQSLGFYFARMSGSNSQLSDKEREVFEQPLSLIDRVVNKGYRLGIGDLSPKMRKDLLVLANTIENKSKLQAKKYLDSNKRKAKESAGTYWNDSVDKAFPTFDELAVSADEMMGSQLNGNDLGDGFSFTVK